MQKVYTCDNLSPYDHSSIQLIGSYKRVVWLQNVDYWQSHDRKRTHSVWCSIFEREGKGHNRTPVRSTTMQY